ncbi:MAG: hypothetical protein AB1568_01515 [Thermodesulfobacteriota bacterium]
MKTVIDIWDELGQLPPEESIHVLTRLFALYEGRLAKDAEDNCAREFFRHLAAAVDQTAGCNLNRR